ncbi:MAG: glycosyltransferase family 2 protein [Candidatus Aminicenantes bacterium]|nr:glycosyltransferase family 2 protein [Candidatus Aminicenantes bacterium]
MTMFTANQKKVPASKNNQKDFCVIIPTVNEAETIGTILDKVKEFTDKILVVDGGSKDGTVEVAQQRGVQVVFDNKQGKGDALRVGVDNTRSEIIVFIDADGSHEISDIPKLVKPIQEGTADLVVGSRIIGGSDELHGTFNKFIRNTGTNFLAVLVNKKWKTELSDIENGFRAIKRNVFKSINLKSPGFTIEQEMVLRCLKNNYKVMEVASHEYARKSGYSKLKTIQGFRFLLHFFKEYLF